MAVAHKGIKIKLVDTDEKEVHRHRALAALIEELGGRFDPRAVSFYEVSAPDQDARAIVALDDVEAAAGWVILDPTAGPIVESKKGIRSIQQLVDYFLER